MAGSALAPGGNLPLVGGIAKGIGGAAGSVAGGVGGAVAGNALAGESKKKKNNQNESFQAFNEKAQKCWDNYN